MSGLPRSGSYSWSESKTEKNAKSLLLCWYKTIVVSTTISGGYNAMVTYELITLLCLYNCDYMYMCYVKKMCRKTGKVRSFISTKLWGRVNHGCTENLANQNCSEGNHIRCHSDSIHRLFSPISERQRPYNSHSWLCCLPCYTKLRDKSHHVGLKALFHICSGSIPNREWKVWTVQEFQNRLLKFQALLSLYTHKLCLLLSATSVAQWQEHCTGLTKA